MISRKRSLFPPGSLARLLAVACAALLWSGYAAAATGPFKPGEVLQYNVSWSKMVTAGTAVMEVKEGPLQDGRQLYQFVLSGRSSGVVDKLFPVNDRLQSVFDPSTMQSLSYTSVESFGRKKRNRSLVFDRAQNTVVVTLDNDLPQTIPVSTGVQDGLASLYFLRSMKDLAIGSVATIDVHDSGRNYCLEVLPLARERVRTQAGEFETIKIRTRPLVAGVYQNKGEVLIWLTDDTRRIPVLMQTTLKVGSFVFSLQDMKFRSDGSANPPQQAAR